MLGIVTPARTRSGCCLEPKSRPPETEGGEARTQRGAKCRMSGCGEAPCLGSVPSSLLLLCAAGRRCLHVSKSFYRRLENITRERLEAERNTEETQRHISRLLAGLTHAAPRLTMQRCRSDGFAQWKVKWPDNRTAACVGHGALHRFSEIFYTYLPTVCTSRI